MFPLPRSLAAFLLAPLLACGPSISEPPDCARYEFPRAPAVSYTHLTCSSTTCGDGQNPPTGGNHCGDTVRCRAHDTEQNRCVWLHNLEHGHAVFLYNCPEGCPELVASLDSLRQEAKAGGNGVIRAVVAPDSQLPKRVAALLWRRAWVADTLDPEAVRCLLKFQDLDAPEPDLPCLP